MKKFLSVLGISLLTILLLAGCGDSDSESVSGSKIESRRSKLASNSETKSETVSDSNSEDDGVKNNSLNSGGIFLVGATADDVQKATENFLSTCVSIGTKAAELDADAQAEFQQELQDLQTKLTEEVASIDTADYDAQLSAIIDIEAQFKTLAAKYGIDVDSDNSSSETFNGLSDTADIENTDNNSSDSDVLSDAINALEANLPEDFKNIMTRYISISIAFNNNADKLTADAINKIQTELSPREMELGNVIAVLMDDPYNMDNMDFSSASEEMAALNEEYSILASECGITIKDIPFREGFATLMAMLLSQ